MVEGAELCRLRKNRREERLWSRFHWDFSPEFEVDDLVVECTPGSPVTTALSLMRRCGDRLPVLSCASGSRLARHGEEERVGTELRIYRPAVAAPGPNPE